MSSSFVEYRERGFWSWDGYLEHVLALLADRIGKSPKHEWLEQLRAHWINQSSGNFRGWIHPNLDEFLTDDERRDIILALLDEITSQSDLPSEAKDTANLFQKLLRGQLATNASSPLDYMVSGPHPYKWSKDD